MAEQGQRGVVRWRRLAVESFVIALGVFLGLAADAAWGARQDGIHELSYLHQLDADLMATERGLAQAMEAQAAAVRAASAALNGINAIAQPPSDSLAQWLGGAFHAPRFEPTMGTVVGLIQTGDIVLISDQGLRTELLAYQQEAQSFLNTGGRFLELRLRAIEDLGRMTNVAALPTRTVLVNRALPAPDFDSLSQVPAFLSAVSILATVAANREQFLEALEAKVRRVREALDRAMESQGLRSAAP
jgi:hypothetical protein